MEYMINNLRMNEIDGYRFIEWQTKSDFDYQAEKGDAIQIFCKNISYQGILSDFDEKGFYLRTSLLAGVPQTYIMYDDVVNIEQLGK